MSEDHPEGRFTFRLTNDASSACIGALIAALQAVTEMVVFPDRVKIDDISPLARLEYANEHMVNCVKPNFNTIKIESF